MLLMGGLGAEQASIPIHFELLAYLTASAFHVCEVTCHCPARVVSELSLSRTSRLCDSGYWLLGTFVVARALRSLGKLAIRVQDRCHLAWLDGQVVDNRVLCASLGSEGLSLFLAKPFNLCYRLPLFSWHCGSRKRKQTRLSRAIAMTPMAIIQPIATAGTMELVVMRMVKAKKSLITLPITTSMTQRTPTATDRVLDENLSSLIACAVMILIVSRSAEVIENHSIHDLAADTTYEALLL